ncbi:MAG: hypothetical protein JWN44_5784 [Myxococcales bacterium]|nr:hypothetical protein [Myxococcales bacterium]
MEAAESLAAGRGLTLIGLEVTLNNPSNGVARALYHRLGYRDSGLGNFISGYTYWDSAGVPKRDEELHLLSREEARRVASPGEIDVALPSGSVRKTGNRRGDRQVGHWG